MYDLFPDITTNAALPYQNDINNIFISLYNKLSYDYYCVKYHEQQSEETI